jgi:hypothetical protein
MILILANNERKKKSRHNSNLGQASVRQFL